MSNPTIFALSSGALPSGVAIIRVSGPETDKILEAMIGVVTEPRRAVLAKLFHPATGEQLDEVLVVYFKGPKSFTGEDLVEFHCHGGRAVISGVLEALSAFEGTRPAEAGEFTRRAFDAGRMDLTEVEGLSDLIAAETSGQRKQALRQMNGALSELYDGWRKRLISTRALIEADFDFADEEDVPDSVADEVWGKAQLLCQEIERHLDQSKNGERLRSGVQVVLMGAPNAGKSSLLNAISGRDVAIVTSEAGTTRDVIEVHLDLGGYPVTLVDTAGLREAKGIVEQEGIRRAQERGRAADLILWAVEPSGIEVTDPVSGLSSEFLSSVPVWTIRTKSDLSQGEGVNQLDGDIVIPVSASADGVSDLLQRLVQFVEETVSFSDTPLASRARHRHFLNECVSCLQEGIAARHLPAELRAEDLRRAADALGRITGRIDVEDLLDVIFRDFCIGK